ncbi:hypothetical protein KSP40_PGU017670 [Platanthera guangdongensis]|uniref:Uncharacterized protein n=1 Tax=Platanthera guangdongensis TaxID=2320717 RepID=A0ABR2M8S4_9ASPA
MVEVLHWKRARASPRSITILNEGEIACDYCELFWEGIATEESVMVVEVGWGSMECVGGTSNRDKKSPLGMRFGGVRGMECSDTKMLWSYLGILSEVAVKTAIQGEESSNLMLSTVNVSSGICTYLFSQLVQDFMCDMGDRKKGKAEHALQSPEDIEYGPGGAMGARNQFDDVKLFSGDRSPGGGGYKNHARRGDVPNAVNNSQYISKGTEHEESGREREHGNRSKKKFDKVLHLTSTYSDFDDTQDIDKQQHKRSNNNKLDINDSSESDSLINDKKETKRKRKEDKRLRKEEKRRRREERRQKRSERRAAKQKLRTKGALSPPSDIDKYLSEADDSDGGVFQKKNSHRINVKETESEQKRLEIELRKKALESLRAKKAIND